jgi:hypothetical protein
MRKAVRQSAIVLGTAALAAVALFVAKGVTLTSPNVVGRFGLAVVALLLLTLPIASFAFLWRRSHWRETLTALWTCALVILAGLLAWHA